MNGVRGSERGFGRLAAGRIGVRRRAKDESRDGAFGGGVGMGPPRDWTKDVEAQTRVSSLSGMAAALSAPIAAMAFGRFPEAVMLLALALMVVWKHSDNIKRLMAGTEPKVGQKSE